MPSNSQPAKTLPAQVSRIASEHFGIEGTVSPLSSERDETFIVTAARGERFILKIAHPDEEPGFLAFQTAAIQHLAATNSPSPVPKVVPSHHGPLITLAFDDGTKRLVRALTFLEGIQLFKAPRSKPQMSSLGRALAQVDSGLSQFKGIMPKQNLLWDISNANALRSHIDQTDQSRRGMILGLLDDFQALFEGTFNDLPRQVIHNDFNPHNVLVSSADPTVVTGIIDFGDAVEAPRINDLAIALSYQVGDREGLGDALELLKGYHQTLRLRVEEIQALPTLLRTRMCMTLVISEWRAQAHPENRDYILRNHPAALAGLSAISEYTDIELARLFTRELGEM